METSHYLSGSRTVPWVDGDPGGSYARRFIRRPEGLSSPPQTESYYTELPVEISVYGGYHQVGSFLAELANMNRIVTVSKLKLATNLKGDPLNTTSASLTASTYSLNTAAETTPLSPAPPKKENVNARKQS